jgi:predicted transcriptional regulator
MARHNQKIVVELADDIRNQVETLAEKTGRSEAELVTDAVETYLRNSARWQKDMDAALDGIRDGYGYDGDEVLAWLESWGTEAEMPRPGPSKR